MQIRSLGFRTDLMLRRLAGADIVDRDHYVVVRTARNPTFYWGNFVLFPQPPRNDDEARHWLATYAAEHHHATHIAIGVDGTNGDLGTTDVLWAAGLEPEVSVVLTARTLIPRTDADAHAVFRPLVSDDDWAQAVELRLVIDDDSDERHRTFAERRQRELRDLVQAGHGTYVGAFLDGRLRSTLGLFAADGVARYQSVETHPDFRRRGLAGALLVLAQQVIADVHPVEHLVIVADPDYVAIDLYRRLGFDDSERQVQWQRAPHDATG